MLRKYQEISLLFNRIEGSKEGVFPECFQEIIEKTVLQLLSEPFSNLVIYQKIALSANCLAGHSIRTALIATGIGRNLQLDLPDRMELGIGAILHDIGKLRIDKKILNKPSKLSEEEFERVKAHPQIGFELLKNQTWIATNSLNVIKNHHERLNGSGYPDQKTGKELHLFDQITAVADAFDAMTSKRNYRKSYSMERAYQVLLSESLAQLNEQVVAILGEMIVYNGVSRNQERRIYDAVVNV